MKKVCGIIGGMGPLATVDFFYKVVINTKANCDNEHVHLIIDNNTSIPDRSNYILSKTNSPFQQLLNSAKKLESAGCNFLCIPCNTCHYFYDDIKKEIKIPIINMIEEVMIYLTKHNIKTVGLLSSTGTIKSHIYDKFATKYGITLLKPNAIEQEIVMSFIYDEVKSKSSNYNLDGILSVIENLKDKNIEALILGCTELPIALNENNTKITCIDSTLILAKKVITYADCNII